MEADANRQNRLPPPALTQYQDRALELIRQALGLMPEGERGRFWREFVQANRALGPIRRTAEFARLERCYSIAQGKPMLAREPDAPPALPEHK
jgi:hypothetical protein